MKIKNLQSLDQYYFERSYFVETIKTHAPLLDDFIFDNGCEVQLDSFKIFRNHDEFYIIHMDSGIMINWYKHLGRTNTCSRNITKECFIEFLKLLHSEIEEYIKDHKQDRDKIATIEYLVERGDL